MKVQFKAYVEDEIKKKFNIIAIEKGKNMSELTEELMKQFIKQEEKK